jgi:hypothetical protein
MRRTCGSWRGAPCASGSTSSAPRLAVATPRNCSWGPRNILYCKSLWEIISWAQVTFPWGSESRAQVGADVFAWQFVHAARGLKTDDDGN